MEYTNPNQRKYLVLVDRTSNVDHSTLRAAIENLGGKVEIVAADRIIEGVRIEEIR